MLFLQPLDTKIDACKKFNHDEHLLIISIFVNQSTYNYSQHSTSRRQQGAEAS